MIPFSLLQVYCLGRLVEIWVERVVNIHVLGDHFHDGGKRSFQFGFHRPTMEAVPLGQLRRFMETSIIPMVLSNPGMQTFYGPDGLTVREKVPN